MAEVTEHVTTVSTDAAGYQWTCTCGFEAMPRRGKPREALADAPCPRDKTVDGLCTLQMSWGGMFDGHPADGYQVHLVRHVRGGGTPGPTLCDIDRFAKDGPGWSVGGGLSGPSITHRPCPGCAEAAREQFPGLEITGIGAREMADVLGAPWSHWNSGRFTRA